MCCPLAPTAFAARPHLRTAAQSCTTTTAAPHDRQLLTSVHDNSRASRKPRLTSGCAIRTCMPTAAASQQAAPGRRLPPHDRPRLGTTSAPHDRQRCPSTCLGTTAAPHDGQRCTNMHANSGGLTTGRAALLHENGRATRARQRHETWLRRTNTAAPREWPRRTNTNTVAPHEHGSATRMTAPRTRQRHMTWPRRTNTAALRRQRPHDRPRRMR
jgi:hypothetical protein